MTTRRTLWRRHSSLIAVLSSMLVLGSTGYALSAPGSNGSPSAGHVLERAGGSTNASTRYSWGQPLYDYGFEYGESIQSPAARGTQRGAGWLDASDGTGRVTHYNGGMTLDSSGGFGDYGTTSATLSGHGQPTGRWEFRFRWLDRGSHPALIQLVRPGSDGTACAAPITVADVEPNGSQVHFGTTSGSHTYAASKSLSLGSDPHNFAVEVASRHITWFYDGRPVASTSTKQAIPGGALTPRVSLQGDSHRDSDTSVIYDWLRGWKLGGGHQAKGGNRLHSSSDKLGC